MSGDLNGAEGLVAPDAGLQDGSHHLSQCDQLVGVFRERADQDLSIDLQGENRLLSDSKEAGLLFRLQRASSFCYRWQQRFAHLSVE